MNQTAVIPVPVRTISVKQAAGQALLLASTQHMVFIDYLKTERKMLLDQAGIIGARIQAIDDMIRKLNNCCNDQSGS